MNSKICFGNKHRWNDSWHNLTGDDANAFFLQKLFLVWVVKISLSSKEPRVKAPFSKRVPFSSLRNSHIIPHAMVLDIQKVNHSEFKTHSCMLTWERLFKFQKSCDLSHNGPISFKNILLPPLWVAFSFLVLGMCWSSWR